MPKSDRDCVFYLVLTDIANERMKMSTAACRIIFTRDGKKKTYSKSMGDGDRLFNVTVMGRGFCHIGRTSANCDDYDGEGNGSWVGAGEH